MITRKKRVDGGHVIEYMAERTGHIKLEVMNEFDADGTRMYKLSDGTERIADVFDNMFNPKIAKAAIKPEGYKGSNPDRTRDWMK